MRGQIAVPSFSSYHSEIVDDPVASLVVLDHGGAAPSVCEDCFVLDVPADDATVGGYPFRDAFVVKHGVERHVSPAS